MASNQPSQAYVQRLREFAQLGYARIKLCVQPSVKRHWGYADPGGQFTDIAIFRHLPQTLGKRGHYGAFTACLR
jgi:hypothetical protein